MKKINLLICVAAAAVLSSCCSERRGLVSVRELNKGWSFKQADEGKWMRATVPGCVHTDLMNNDVIEDPFYRLNEHDVQWIDKKDWEYKTTFSVDKATLGRDRVALDFKGLDTYAEVSLNGEKILSSDNMFREYMVDVKPLLKSGRNELHILFRSPINEGIRKHDAYLPYTILVSDNDKADIGQVEGEKQVSVFTRKAGYHFAWDWGPRLVSSGVWRPVFLTAWDDARIENVRIVQHSVDSTEACFTAEMEIEAENDAQAAKLFVVNKGDTLAETEVALKKGVSVYPLDFSIMKPELWWTNGLGAQKLYKLKCVVTVNGKSDIKKETIGIRTLELVREKDKHGTSFYFKLNGVPVFMKGANYIPNDIFPARVTHEMYENVVNTAKESNFNMLRVWGGGIYEYDQFYDLCDKAGILVWQDFMFACSMFPGDSAFLENVRYEAIDNVKRLRNHPSIALWCGNNEVLETFHKKKEKAEAESKENVAKMWKAYEDIFHGVLKEVVAGYDPSRFYWSSSPSSGEGVQPDLVNGDGHYWGVWWGKEPFANYATYLARFMSEYGFQSFPELRTVETYALPEDYDIFSEVMKSHQRSFIGNGTIEYYMDQEYNKPKDFASFLYVGQVLQAEGVKFALEGHRRAMPYCMGTLYWQINDCWPVASWSSTDYLQRWKALQYFAKKGFESVLVSPYTEKGRLKVNIVNDKLTALEGTLATKTITFDGKEICRKEENVKVPANSSTVVIDIDRADFLKDKDERRQMVVLEFMDQAGNKSSNVYYFRPFKELDMCKPNVDMKVISIKGGFDIKLKTDKLAKNVFLSIGGEPGFFSDNYFDLLPGEDVTVHVDSPLSAGKFKKVLKLRTLEDAF